MAWRKTPRRARDIVLSAGWGDERDLLVGVQFNFGAVLDPDGRAGRKLAWWVLDREFHLVLQVAWNVPASLVVALPDRGVAVALQDRQEFFS